MSINLDIKKNLKIDQSNSDNFQFIKYKDEKIATLNSIKKELLILDDNFNIQETIDISFIDNYIFKGFWFDKDKILFQHAKIDFSGSDLIPDNNFSILEISSLEITSKQSIASDENIFYINEKFYILKGKENLLSFYEFNPKNFEKKLLQKDIIINQEKKCNSKSWPKEVLEDIICRLKNSDKPVSDKNAIYSIDSVSNKIKIVYRNYKDLTFEKDIGGDVEINSSNYTSLYEYKNELFLLVRKDLDLKIIQVEPVYDSFNYRYLF